MATVVTLSNPLTFVTHQAQPAQSKTLTSVTFNRTIDIPDKQVVAVHVHEVGHPIVLWQGAAYNQLPASTWTNADIIAQLTAILNSGHFQIINDEGQIVTKA